MRYAATYIEKRGWCVVDTLTDTVVARFRSDSRGEIPARKHAKSLNKQEARV